MTYVVAEPCIKCKYTDCVEVCPDECIDCNACVPVCPVEAIYPDDELPEKWAHYEEWNAYLAGQWRDLERQITEKQDPLPEADYWAGAEKSEEDILSWDDPS